MKTLKLIIIAGLATALAACGKMETADEETAMPDYALAIHGGAGTILRANMSAQMEAEYRAALLEALAAGENVLADGGAAVDAVVATLTVLEDNPLFNAGKGAVFTNAGTNELDASLMDGATLNVGAVAGVKTVRNPIHLARAVMHNSPHVMLQSTGAEEFAREQGLEIVEQDYFYTERRWQSLQRARDERETNVLDPIDIMLGDKKFGTVGAVALDRNGNVAAGTSTGGLTNKRWGRVGDSPIIGAGTYASNDSCAVSATGDGEYFIRATVARTICALVEYEGRSIQDAADQVIFERVGNLGGTGGVVTMDNRGTVAFSFNTEGMYRGHLIAGQSPWVGIYKDDSDSE